MIKKICLNFALALVLVIPAWVATSATEDYTGTDGSLRTVIAEGVGAGADKAKARDDAITDAQRRAVEQGLGLYIKSETIVVNFELLDDKIYRHSEGYVHTYEILSENYDNEVELYRVKIKAELRLGKIEQDLDDLWERLRLAGNPRILIDIGQNPLGSDDNLVNSIITNELVSLGFQVFDAGLIDEANEKTALKIIRGGNFEAAAVMALQDKADVVIAGKAICDNPELLMSDPAVFSARASVNAQAVSTDTGQVISSAIGNSTKSGFSSERAASAALIAASKDWVKENLGLIVKKIVDPTHTLLIKVSNCSYTDLDIIEEALIDIRFVRQSRLIAYDQGFAQLEVQYTGTANTLADAIAESEIIKLQIDSITANTILMHII